MIQQKNNAQTANAEHRTKHLFVKTPLSMSIKKINITLFLEKRFIFFIK